MFLIMATMTGKRMAEKMRQYGNALEAMSNEAVEYVRGIPVVKTFGQSVFSFKKFKATIDEYEKWVVSEKVQEKLAKNKKAPARQKAGESYLLTTKLPLTMLIRPNIAKNH